MKFGKTLVRNQFPQWAGNYIAYKGLKKLIVAAVARKKELGGQIPDVDPAMQAFFTALDNEVEKINTFFLHQIADSMLHCEELTQRYHLLNGSGSNPTTPISTPPISAAPSPQRAPSSRFNPLVSPQPRPDGPVSPFLNDNATLNGDGIVAEFYKQEGDDEDLLDEVYALKDELDSLVDYHHVNIEGVRKILKKFDKRMRTQFSSDYMSKKVNPLPVSTQNFPETIAPLERAVCPLVRGAHASVEDGRIKPKNKDCDWKTYEF